mmetsp:Transcript_24775/g.36543  ORF Transcript_24775/g.36543 Transcript_24775/m.36543 type:complete len:311 (+) Transcript_24775:49-981(+)
MFHYLKISNDFLLSACLVALFFLLSVEIYDHFGPQLPKAVTKRPVKKKRVNKATKRKVNKVVYVQSTSGKFDISSSALEAMRKAFPNEPESTLIRFLIARKGSVVKATEMLTKSMTWRNGNMPPKKGYVQPALDTRTIFVHGTAKDSTPVVYFRGPLYDAKAATKEQYVLAAAYVIDQALLNCAKADSEYDLASQSVTVLVHTAHTPGAINAPADVSFIKAFVQTLSDNYPERLKRLVVYPFPWYGRAVWQVIKAFLDPRTADKVTLLAQGPEGEYPCPPDMNNYVDINTVPVECGGKSDAKVVYPTLST